MREGQRERETESEARSRLELSTWGSNSGTMRSQPEPQIQSTQPTKPPRRPYLFIILKVHSFILRASKHVRAGEGQREMVRENPNWALHCQCRAPCEAQTLKTVRSWPELKSGVIHLTDWATQAPPKLPILDLWQYFYLYLFIFTEKKVCKF